MVRFGKKIQQFGKKMVQFRKNASIRLNKSKSNAYFNRMIVCFPLIWHKISFVEFLEKCKNRRAISITI